MKDLENVLREVSKPTTTTPHFQRKLHHELMSAQHTKLAMPYRGLFAAAALCALVLLAITTTLVARPGLAQALHQRLGGSQTLPMAQQDGTPPAQQLNAGQMEDLRRLIQQDFAPPAQDKAYLEAAFDGQLGKQPLQVQPLAEQIYTVRRYRLADGREAVVYTELETPPQESY